MDDIYNYTNTVQSFIHQGDNGYKSLREALKRDIDRRKDVLEGLERCLKTVDNLRFKPGSIVIHRTFGNGMVLCPYIGELMENEGISISSYKNHKNLVEMFENDLNYVVQFVKQENDRVVFTKEIVKEEDIIPYTDASKVLYGE